MSCVLCSFLYINISIMLLKIQQKKYKDWNCLIKMKNAFVFKRTKKLLPHSSNVCKNDASSAPSGTRTLDTLIKSQVLYQLS